MKRGRIVEFTALGLAIGLSPTLAAAQSVDVPLNYALNTGYNFGAAPSSNNPVLILTINVGVNGGAAQAYAFDTGSAEFLAPNGTFGNTALQSGLSNVETYTGNTFGGNLYQIPASSLKFYAASGATSGGVSLGTSGNYTVASYTSLNGSTPPPTTQPFGSAVVGAFGAEPQAFTVAGTNVAMGSIFGQTNLPNTTAGWVVSANGQSLTALSSQLGTSIAGGPVTGAQQSIQTVPQSVTSCNPCVTVGLTPALLAQFLPLNTVQSPSAGVPFPNSNVQGYDKFVPLNFTLSSPTTTLHSQNVSLDSGFTDFHLDIGPNYATSFPNPVLTVSANGGGTQETFNAINPNFTSAIPNAPSPYSLRNTGDPTTNFLGIGFFLENSVLYNLAGQVEGFSPYFVTDANITTTSGSPLVIGSNSVPLGLAGIISGSGGISITGGGSASLSGTNTYTGPTSVSGGMLALLGPGSIATSSGVNVSAGGVFDISDVTNGAAIKSLAGDANGVVYLGGQTLILTAANGVFAGTITGAGGLTLTGGAQALLGTSSYGGATSVSGGTLEVDGSIAGSNNVTVGAGGVLSGTGLVDPPTTTIAAGGMLAPGNAANPTGTLTITGNLLFNSAATYLVTIAGSGTSKTDISGNASLAGTVAVIFNAAATARSYDILSSASLNGSAFGGAISLNPNYAVTLGYSPTDASLGVTAQLGAGASLNPNQQAVANVISAAFNNGQALPSGLSGLFGSSGAGLGNALTQLDGEDATGAEHGAFELTNEFLSLMLDPFVSGRGGAASGCGPLGFAPDQGANLPPDVALAYAGILKAPPKPLAPLDQRWTVWGASYGGSATFDGSPAVGSANVTASTYGFAAGADYHIAADTILGFALAGAGTNWGLAQGLGTGRSDAFQAGVYGTRYFGPAYIGAALAYTDNWFTTNRTALGDQLTANFQGQSHGVRVESGYRYAAAPAIGVTPYAAIQAQDFHTPAYSESDLTGGGFGLSYNAMNATDTRSELGARFDDLTTWGASPVQLRARIAWAHDWVNNPALDASFQALPGTSFLVNGAPVPHDSALTSVGAELHLTPRWTLLGKFDGEFASSAQTYAGSGTLRYVW